MSTTKQIKALTGFHHVTDADVLNRGIQVETSLTGNSHFPNPPVDLATLKAALDTFAALIPQALDRSKKVIAEKKKQRTTVIQMLKVVASYGHDHRPGNRHDVHVPGTRISQEQVHRLERPGHIRLRITGQILN